MALGFNIFVVALLVVVIVTIAMGVRTIPQGYAYTVERFGRYARTLGAGARAHRSLCRAHRPARSTSWSRCVDVPSQEAFTRDNAGVTIDAAVFYQVLDAARASYEVSNLEQALPRP